MAIYFTKNEKKIFSLKSFFEKVSLVGNFDKPKNGVIQTRAMIAQSAYIFSDKIPFKSKRVKIVVIPIIQREKSTHPKINERRKAILIL
jgi:hypothetical protein